MPSLSRAVRRTTDAAIAAVAMLAAGTAAQAQTNFYAGKTVTIVIGSSTGGGYDTYARLISRHLGKHIPGNPGVVPSNMPGAGSNVAAAAVFRTLPKDGTQIGAIYASAMLEPLIGEAARIHHDPSKFNNLGSASNEIYTCMMRADAPVQSIEDARKTEAVLGATADGGSTVDFPNMESRFLGTKFKVVRGYAGSREVLLAIERNEVQGACGLTWSVLSTSYPDLATDTRFKLIAQEDMTGIPELNARGVPVTGKLAPDDTARQALELFYAQNILGRPYVVAPEVPQDRVAILRTAFMETLKDPDLLADAQKVHVTINPTTGEQVQALIAKLYATPPNVIEMVRTTLARTK